MRGLEGRCEGARWSGAGPGEKLGLQPGTGSLEGWGCDVCFAVEKAAVASGWAGAWLFGVSGCGSQELGELIQ